MTYKLNMIIVIISGRSSGVERNLAKVEVEGSNPFARSRSELYLKILKLICNVLTMYFIIKLIMKIL